MSESELRLKVRAAMGAPERRAIDPGGLELREQDDGMLHLAGYASVSERPYEVGSLDAGGFVEVIKRGAFKRTLGENCDVSLLVGHEGLPLARSKSTVGMPTLRLSEDEHGLAVDATLDPRDPDVQRLERKMAGGLIDAMSMAFRVTAEAWSRDGKRREIRSLNLNRGDVSMVVHPANEGTSATLRSAAEPVAIPDYTTRARQEIDAYRLGLRRTARSSTERRPSMQGASLPNHTTKARLEIERLRLRDR